ncbi:hypothetical protein T484DRAFT_1877668 [Baffinella frigidus]|nr:hypothetical protein T484DRAFT_1877668 [Cryptophyta sp. CCMP2293]
MPKKPLNAFQLWFNVSFKGLQEERPGSTRSDIMSLGGERWRALPDQLKDVYRSKNDDLQDIWGKEQREEEREGASRKNKGGGGFFAFCAKERPAVREANPGINMPQLAKMMGEKWRNLTEEEKEPFSPTAKMMGEKWRNLTEEEKEPFSPVWKQAQ